MPSDIYVKKNTGWSTAVTSIKAKTNTGWSSAIRYVYAKINAGWTRVWPLSGVYPTTNPFISNNTTTTSEISYGTVLRVGTNYKGDRGVWNPNGYTISSYDYKWMAFASETGSSVNYEQAFSSLSGSTNTFLITGTTLANFDRGWITFRVRANASNSAYSGTADSFRYYVARQKPVISTGPTLSKTNPSVGDTINYSSGWNTTDAYKPDAARSTINWYKSTSSSLTESQLKALTPIQSSGYSYIVQSTDANNYIYAMEEVFNSGTDLESLVNGVTAIVKTTSLVGVSPGAFSYSLTNVSSVTTPSAPVQQRVSSTSNTVLIELSSAFPSDTESYELWTYGSGSATGGTLANPATQSITVLNQWDSNGNSTVSGSWDTVTNISSSASNSPINTFSKAVGKSRTLQFNVSSTTGAQSWAINFTISSASAGNGTYTLNTNSMPAQTIISGVSNPTVTINSITAYSNLDQAGSSTAGSAGTTTSISSITKPTAFSTTSTSNYTFYTNYQLTGSQRRVTLPSAFTSGTTIYVSTNGYVNWGGDDPGGAIAIPALATSGITVAPLAGDLRQGAVSAAGTTSTGGLWYYSDATNYWVTYWGNYYNDAAQVARYQVKFYWGQSYADIYIINNSLTTITPSTTAVQNGANATQDWSATTAQTSTLLSTASMNRVFTQDGVDDNRTAIIASVPAIIPTITMGVNSGISSTAGTINWTSTNQSTWSSTGTFSGSGTTETSISKTGLSPSSTYVGTVTVTSSTGNTASATYSLTTSATPTWTVTWDANGGTGGGTTTENQGLSHTAPSPGTKTGYDFSYYRYPASGGTDPVFVLSGGSYTPTASVTFGAIWTLKTYSVTYNANGGTGAPATQTKTHDTALTLSSTAPTRASVGNTSYTFNGWNTASDGSGTSYSAGGSYTTNAALNLYAQWTSTTATSYTVSYSANGGTGTVPTSQVTTGTITVANVPTFTRTNCTLGAGWNTNSAGTGTNIAAGASFTPTADTVLYAKWTANANSATAPPGFAFAGNNLPSAGRKQWTWTGTGTVTGGVRTGFRVEISSTSSTTGFSIATGSPLATSARSFDIAVSPVTSLRWVRIASEYTDGLGVTRVGTFTAAL